MHKLFFKSTFFRGKQKIIIFFNGFWHFFFLFFFLSLHNTGFWGQNTFLTCPYMMNLNYKFKMLFIPTFIFATFIPNRYSFFLSFFCYFATVQKIEDKDQCIFSLIKNFLFILFILCEGILFNKTLSNSLFCSLFLLNAINFKHTYKPIKCTNFTKAYY